MKNKRILDLCTWMCICVVYVPLIFSREIESILAITDIQTVNHQMLSVPTKTDISVFWETYQRSSDGQLRVDTTLCSEYRVLYGTKENLSEMNLIFVRQTNFIKLESIPVKKHMAIIVEGISKNRVICTSDTAWIATGKIHAKGAFDSGSWINWIPFNGRIVMWMIGKEDVFDTSTRAGKFAFHLLWNFGIIGLVIWIFFCGRILGLANIFPFKKGTSFGQGFEGIYKVRIREDFVGIIREWQEIVEASNHAVRDMLRNGNQKGDSPSLSLNDVMLQSAKFWQQEGMDRVHQLLEKSKSKELRDLPAVRIIRAGLENHELGGLHWMEVSREVDRAIENRASSELEKLRRNSLMDWFWNLGTMAPLVGLFGTATGISHAFALLTELRTEITQTALVKQLSSGIYEALWTTILGLFIGILLMLLYYFYQNKLNWIYSKWEELYVQVSEKL